MLTALLSLAAFQAEPVFPAPRVDGIFPLGSVDFDLDGRDDPYSFDGVVLSDGAFGGTLVPIPYHGGMVRTADMNGDGHPDLITGNNGPAGVQVALFEPATETFSSHLWPEEFTHEDEWAAGDVDGDGDLDLFVSAGTFVIQLGDGAGDTTGTVPGGFPGPFPESRLGDLNGDGLADLVVTRGSGILVALATGGGAFATPAAIDPAISFFDIDLVDVDADGKLDLLAVHPFALRVYPGDGLGGFGAPSSFPLPVQAELRLTLADYDGSGSLDALVPEHVPSTRLLVLKGDGAGGFGAPEAVELGCSAPNFFAGDFDGDGNLDLGCGDVVQAVFASSKYYRAGMLLEREGDGVVHPTQLLPEPTPTFTGSAADVQSATTGDVDGDGDDDVLWVSGGGLSAAKVQVMRHDGAGGFTVQPGPAVLPLVAALALADVANDGKIDLLGFPWQGVGLSLQAGDGAGGFGAPLLLPFSLRPHRTEIADFSGDGFVDLLGVNALPGSFLHYHAGMPTVSFGPQSAVLTPGTLNDVAAADVDLDGDLDAIALGKGRLFTFAGNGAGGFALVQDLSFSTVAGTPLGLAAGDFDDDGWPDAVLSDGRWYHGVGGGLQAFVGQPYVPVDADKVKLTPDVTAADLDGDGVDDAVLDDGTVLLGGPGGLAFDRSYYGAGTLRVELGELTGDGSIDLLAQHNQNGLVILQNLKGCPGTLEPYGTGCVGSTGITPVLTGSGCPTPGGSYWLEVSGGLPGSPAFASFGLGQGAIPLPNGCTLLLNPWLPIFLGFTLDAGGQGQVGVAVSPVSQVGITLTAQVGIFDPGHAGFFTVTNGLSITVN